MNIEPAFMKPENRFREMINLDFVFQPCVFLPSEDNEFPKGEFINPDFTYKRCIATYESYKRVYGVKE